MIANDRKSATLPSWIKTARLRGATAIPFQVPANRWSQERAQGMSAAELLLYRSNLLGSDLTVTNFGGGNTSAKLTERDPLTGESVQVLWVKGSGGDIGSMKLDGFSTLYLDKLLRLEKLYRGKAHEDEMVGYLASLHVQPECARGFDRYAASCVPAVRARRSCASGCHHFAGRFHWAVKRPRVRSGRARSAGWAGSDRASISACDCGITLRAILLCAV